MGEETAVTRVCEIDQSELVSLLADSGLSLVKVEGSGDIPGSYWGAPEAGLISDRLYFRDDTPVHSALHEAAHFICMGADRRSQLHTDAGGSDVEENAVCYLQCLMADQLSGYSKRQCFKDMDAWGYNFVLGSAADWFAKDAEDAIEFLRVRQLLPTEA